MKVTIKKLSKISGVSIDTIRHYTSVGLLNPIRNNKNNYLYYQDIDLRRLAMIRTYRSFGFSLEKCKEILDTNNVESFQREMEFVLNEIKTRELFLKYARLETERYITCLEILKSKNKYLIVDGDSCYLYPSLYDDYSGKFIRPNNFSEEIFIKLNSLLPICNNYRRIRVDNYYSDNPLVHEIGTMMPSDLIEKFCFNKEDFRYIPKSKYICFVLQKNDEEPFSKELLKPFFEIINKLKINVGDNIMSYMVCSVDDGVRKNYHAINFSIKD